MWLEVFLNWFYKKYTGQQDSKHLWFWGSVSFYNINSGGTTTTTQSVERTQRKRGETTRLNTATVANKVKTATKCCGTVGFVASRQAATPNAARRLAGIRREKRRRAFRLLVCVCVWRECECVFVCVCWHFVRRSVGVVPANKRWCRL